MEPQSPIDSAAKVNFYDNDVENGRNPKQFGDLLTSTDPDVGFAVAETCPQVDLDKYVERTEIALARYHSP